MPNTLAYLVLYMWPLMVLFLFRKLPLRDALVWSIVAGYIFLPGRTGFDLPVLPAVDKVLVPSLSAAVMCLVANRHAALTAANASRLSSGSTRRRRSIVEFVDFKPQRGQALFWGTIFVLFLAPIWTALQNSEAIIQGSRYIQGLKIYDAMSMNSRILVQVLPFLLARRYLASENAHETILRILVIACLGYSLLILYEVRMSPQLNRIFYGFFPHDWTQHLRGSGYRPLVFFQHGLWLAIFVAMSALSAFVLWKVKAKEKGRSQLLVFSLWLFIILIFTRSLGALTLTLMFLPFVLFVGKGTRLIFAGLIAAVVLFYPMTRSLGLIPVDTIKSVAENISAKRADSLQYRLDNEDILLEKANKKPVAGWGIWSRSRVLNERGDIVSVTDGYWIIVLGEYGWLGYLTRFGLLCLPVILLALGRNKLQISAATSGLAIVLTVSLVDLIPNATIGPVVWLIAGAMMGRYQTAEAAVATRPVGRSENTQPTGPAQSEDVGADGLTDGRPLHYRRPRGTQQRA